MLKTKYYRYLSIILCILILIVFMPAGSVFAAISSDKQDYPPGSVVTISGDNSDSAGYLPGETVNVNVNGPNSWVASFEAIVGSDGSWSGTVTLDADPAIAVGDYTYNAIALTSGVTQTGTFKDNYNVISILFIATPTEKLIAGVSGSASWTIGSSWDSVPPHNAISNPGVFRIAWPGGTPEWVISATFSKPTIYFADPSVLTIVISTSAPVGKFPFTVFCNSGDGDKGVAGILDIGRDTTLPNITTPADITTEATSSDGAVVDFLATGTDEVGTVTITYSKNPGTVFPLGETQVTCTATDNAGNSSEKTFMVTVTDTTKPTITRIGSDIVTIEAGNTYNDEGATAFDICDGDLTSSISTINSVNTSLPGNYTITYNVSDSHDNAAAEVTRRVNVVDSVAPVIWTSNDWNINNDPLPFINEMKFTFDASDTFGIDTISGKANGVSFDGKSYDITEAGVYTFSITAIDKSGNMSTREVMIVVYDPSAGFVTGGGWINSPAGAYTSDKALAGKANFGFVSKYKKGQTVPTGNTEFQFKAGNLNFCSTSYQWLIVAGNGTRAQYKCSGTINGIGEYGAILTAIDGGKTGVDKFRIKIWDKSTNAIIYDNNSGVFDSSDDITVISGGSIVIHK